MSKTLRCAVCDQDSTKPFAFDRPIDDIAEVLLDADAMNADLAACPALWDDIGNVVPKRVEKLRERMHASAETTRAEGESEVRP